MFIRVVNPQPILTRESLWAESAMEEISTVLSPL
jgi:hypothetical protein